MSTVCERLTGGLAIAGIKSRRLSAAAIHDWLLRWFNPNPTVLGTKVQDRERFYQLTAYPQESEPGEIELASGTDFSQRLFFSQPRSDVTQGTWYFNGMPHRVMLMDRLITAPCCWLNVDAIFSLIEAGKHIFNSFGVSLEPTD